MSDYRDRAKRYHEAIHHVLLREWDPIGVADIPEAQDEYDGYIHQIHGMLIRHEPKHILFDYLWRVETEHMGLFGNRRRTEDIAGRLVHLREEMEGDAPNAIHE